MYVLPQAEMANAEWVHSGTHAAAPAPSKDSRQDGAPQYSYASLDETSWPVCFAVGGGFESLIRRWALPFSPCMPTAPCCQPRRLVPELSAASGQSGELRTGKYLPEGSAVRSAQRKTTARPPV